MDLTEELKYGSILNDVEVVPGDLLEGVSN
jgi:hypothetical protein